MNTQEKIFAKGKLFELVHREQLDGRVFEVARRAPGVRLIIADKTPQKLLLTKEFRHELNAWDYRLPGGKVFDSLDEYEAFRASEGVIEEAARAKAIQEAAEEAGIQVDSLELYAQSTLGATVEWNLYIFEAMTHRVAEGGQALEAGEQIIAEEWFDYDKVASMIIEGKMQEERVALVVLRWLAAQKGEL